MISEHLVSAFLILKERQTVTKIDDIFKGREKEEGEGKSERTLEHKDGQTIFHCSWECQ